MPRGDGTGPLGMGPMTGRGMGTCAGYVVPGYMTPAAPYGLGFGFGMGPGRGRGFRRMYWQGVCPGWTGYGFIPAGYAAYDEPPANEKEALERQAAFLEKQLDEVRSRLKDLDKD